jgi:hypothetical protein
MVSIAMIVPPKIQVLMSGVQYAQVYASGFTRLIYTDGTKEGAHLTASSTRRRGTTSLRSCPRFNQKAMTPEKKRKNKTMKISKEYKAAWDRVFENLTEEQRNTVLAAPSGSMSARLAIHVDRLVEAREAAKGKGAGAELQLAERLEMENPL